MVENNNPNPSGQRPQQPRTKDSNCLEIERLRLPHPRLLRCGTVQNVGLGDVRQVEIVFLEGNIICSDGAALVSPINEEAEINTDLLERLIPNAQQLFRNVYGDIVRESTGCWSVVQNQDASILRLGFRVVMYVRVLEVNAQDHLETLISSYRRLFSKAEEGQIEVLCLPLLAVGTFSPAQSTTAFTTALTQHFETIASASTVNHLRCIRVVTRTQETAQSQVALQEWPIINPILEERREASSNSQSRAESGSSGLVEQLNEQIRRLRRNANFGAESQFRQLFLEQPLPQLSQQADGDDHVANPIVAQDQQRLRQQEIQRQAQSEEETKYALIPRRSDRLMQQQENVEQGQSHMQQKLYDCPQWNGDLRTAVDKTIVRALSRNRRALQKSYGKAQSWHIDPNYDNQFTNSDFMEDQNIQWYVVWDDNHYYGTQLTDGREILLDEISTLFFQCGARVENVTVDETSPTINKQLIRSMLQLPGVLELALLGLNGKLKPFDINMSVKDFFEYFLQIGLVRTMLARIELQKLEELGALRARERLMRNDLEQTHSITSDTPFLSIPRHLNVGKQAYIGENLVGAKLVDRPEESVFERWQPAPDVLQTVAVPYDPSNELMRSTFKATATHGTNDEDGERRLKESSYFNLPTPINWERESTVQIWCEVPITKVDEPTHAEMQLFATRTQSLAFTAHLHDLGQRMTAFKTIKISFDQGCHDYNVYLSMLQQINNMPEYQQCSKAIRLRNIRPWRQDEIVMTKETMRNAVSSQMTTPVDDRGLELPEDNPSIVPWKRALNMRPLTNVYDSSANKLQDPAAFAQEKLLKFFNEVPDRRDYLVSIQRLFQQTQLGLEEYNSYLRQAHVTLQDWLENTSVFKQLIAYFEREFSANIYLPQPQLRQINQEFYFKTAYVEKPGTPTKEMQWCAPLYVMNSLFDSVIWKNVFQFIKVRYPSSCPDSQEVIDDKLYLIKFVLDGGFKLTRSNGDAVKLVNIGRDRWVGFQEGYKLTMKELVSATTCMRHLNYLLSAKASCSRVLLKVDYEASRWSFNSNNSQLIAARLLCHEHWQICDSSGVWLSLDPKPTTKPKGSFAQSGLLRYFQGAIGMQIIEPKDLDVAVISPANIQAPIIRLIRSSTTFRDSDIYPDEPVDGCPHESVVTSLYFPPGGLTNIQLRSFEITKKMIDQKISEEIDYTNRLLELQELFQKNQATSNEIYQAELKRASAAKYLNRLQERPKKPGQVQKARINYIELHRMKQHAVKYGLPHSQQQRMEQQQQQQPSSSSSSLINDDAKEDSEVERELVRYLQRQEQQQIVLRKSHSINVVNLEAGRRITEHDYSISNAERAHRAIKASGINDDQVVSFIHQYTRHRNNRAYLPQRPESNAPLRLAVVAACDQIQRCSTGYPDLISLLDEIKSYAQERVYLTLGQKVISCQICRHAPRKILEMCPGCNFVVCKHCNQRWQGQQNDEACQKCAHCRLPYDKQPEFVMDAQGRSVLNNAGPPCGRPARIDILLSGGVESCISYNEQSDDLLSTNEGLINTLREEQRVPAFNRNVEQAAVNALKDNIIEPAVVNVDGQTFETERTRILHEYESSFDPNTLTELLRQLVKIYSEELHFRENSSEPNAAQSRQDCFFEYLNHFQQFQARLAPLLLNQAALAEAAGALLPVTFAEQILRASAVGRHLIRTNPNHRQGLRNERVQERLFRAEQNLHVPEQICTPGDADDWQTIFNEVDPERYQEEQKGNQDQPEERKE